MRAFWAAYWPPVLLWVVGLSLAAFCLMGLDKHRAKTGGWRVRERTFFLLALLGGSPGAVLGMQAFRHKTKHWYFKYGLPVLLLLQILTWLIFCFCRK